MIVVNESHLRRVLTLYLCYYHRSRTHLGLEKDTPDRLADSFYILRPHYRDA